MPKRQGRSIVLNDSGYDYHCDLDEHGVEWWIDHVSEKNWWKPAWAVEMRRIAAEIYA